MPHIFSIFNNRLLREYWHENKKRLLLLILLGWIASITTFLIPLSLGAFFDIHFKTHTNKGRLLNLFGFHLETLNSFFAFFFSVIALKIILDFIEKKSISSIADRYVNELVRKLFIAQIRWSNETFDHKPYGHYLLRYSGDMNNIKIFLARGLHGGIKDFLFLLTGLGILFSLNSALTFLLVSLIIACFPFIYWMDLFQKPYIKERDNRKSTLLSFVTRSFSRHYQIKETHAEGEVINEFKQRSKKLLRANLSYDTLGSIRQSLVPGIGYFIVGILLLQVSGYGNKSITGGVLLVYLLVLMSILPALRRLFKISGIVQRGLLSLQKKNQLLIKEIFTEELSSPR